MKESFKKILVLLPIVLLVVTATKCFSVSRGHSEEQQVINGTIELPNIYEKSDGSAMYKKFIVQKRKVESERQQARNAEKQRLFELKQQAMELKKQQEQEPPEKKVATISRGNEYTSTYEITHYTAQCKGCTGKTASGYDVTQTIYYEGYRVVAAPKTIAFNTKLKITYNDGTVIEAIVLDRGGDIGAKRLDLLVSDKKEAYRLGRQSVQVSIIK